MKRMIAVAMLGSVLFSFMLAGCGTSAAGTGNNDPAPVTADSQDTLTDDGQPVYKDGVYSGSGTGYGGPIAVEVTISDGKITQITIGEHTEDSMYMDEAVTIIDEMIATQNADVDAVTGATASCVGIESAVKKALREAQE